MLLFVWRYLWFCIIALIKSLSCVPLFVTPWTVAHQVPQKTKTKTQLRIKKSKTGISLTVWWLGLHALTAEGPGMGTKIFQAIRYDKKEKEIHE